MNAPRALAACALVLASCTRPAGQSAPVARTPRPVAGAASFAGSLPARLDLAARFYDFDPSGVVRLLVRARFRDATGAATQLRSGGNVDFHPSSGTAQWQTRLRFDGPAAIVSVTERGSIDVRVHADVGVPLRDARLRIASQTIGGPRFVARALGPHAVWVGWFPRVPAGSITLARYGPGSSVRRVTISAPASNYRDETVEPHTNYRYAVVIAGRPPVWLRVRVPPDLASTRQRLRAVTGKGVWLSFSPSTDDADGYDKLDARAIVARLRSAGVRSLALRTAYGPFREITPEDRAWVDAVLDAAAGAGIAAIAWTVPRSTAFDDLAAAAESATYRTARGNGFAALAIDLERGDYFLGDGKAGYANLSGYLAFLRGALGTRAILVATVEDPQLEHLTENNYPYAEIAAVADAVQPMVYWHAVLGKSTPQAATSAVARSYAAMLAAARRPIAINLGLQSSAQGARGAPSPREIVAALEQARRAGAPGATFFDWGGTAPAAWDAIARVRW